MKLDFRKNIFLGISVIFVIIFLIVINRNSSFKFVREPIHWIMKPFISISSALGVGVGDTWNFIQSIGQLKSENNVLSEENLRLKAKLADYGDVKRENEDLKKSLELAPKDKYDLVAAMVIGRDMSGHPDVVYLNKGVADGIENGMAAVIGEGVLIGKVILANEHNSAVKLLISKDSKINAEIDGGLAKGVVKGDYGTSVVMDMIPQSVELKPGMTITTSDLGENVPRGLLIGYLGEVLPTADQLFQRATINLPAAIDRLRVVWVIKSAK